MAGRKTDNAGRPLLVRDNRLAARNFGMVGSTFSATPKSKYMFYVRFLRADGAGGSEPAKAALDWTNGVGFALKYIDRPKVTFDQQVLNQYNKKRIVQTRAEYEPLVMRFHDTNDNKVYNLFTEYYRYYYANASLEAPQAWKYDITDPDFIGAGEHGLSLSQNGPNQNYFFDRVEVYQIYGRKKTYKYDLINPKILSFDPDELDYANGSVGLEITMQLNFEDILWHGESELTDDQLATLGLDTGDFFESENAAPTEEAYQKAVSDLGVRTNPSGVEGLLRNTAVASTNAAVNGLLNGRGVDSSNIIQNGIYNGLFSTATNTGSPWSSVTTNAQNQAKSRLGDSVKALKGKLF